MEKPRYRTLLSPTRGVEHGVMLPQRRQDRQDRKDKDHMIPQEQHTVSLPVHWAFVVQFRTNTDITAQHFTGRVEHVASGQTSRFESLEVLLNFFSQVLCAASPPAQALRSRHPTPDKAASPPCM